MKPLCRMRTIKGVIRYWVILQVVCLFTRLFNLILNAEKLNFSGSEIALMVGTSLVGGVLLRIAIPRLRMCLVFCFPVACGHRRCVFTGRSSKTLKDILLSMDRDISTVEKVQNFKEDALRYLDDVKSALEKTMAGTTFHYIFSGSTEEGFSVPLITLYEDTRCVCATCASCSIGPLNADLDVMFFSLEHNASFSGQEDILVEYRVPENDGFTGYAQLTQIGPEFTERLLSSSLVRLKAKEAIRSARILNLPGIPYCCGKTEITSQVRLDSLGPTVKLRIAPVFEADITVCIQCPEWPSMSDWPFRPRYWPSTDEERRIMSLGCHLVAKPAPSDKAETSWRFSFSLAEVELSKLVPATARKCFLALKIILKDHLQPVVPEISSYHIKTIFLNTLEKVPQGFWVKDNIEECFLTLLAELRDTLLYRNCRHHWFSSVNLFHSRGSCFCTKAKSLQILAKKVERILRDPAPFIFDDGCCCLSPCCFRLPQNNFTRRSSEQLLAEYGEVAFSVDGHVFTQPHDTAYYSSQSPISSSPRSAAQLHPNGYCRGADEQGIPAEPDNVVVSLPSRHLTEEVLTYYTGVAEDQEFLVPVQDV